MDYFEGRPRIDQRMMGPFTRPRRFRLAGKKPLLAGPLINQQSNGISQGRSRIDVSKDESFPLYIF